MGEFLSECECGRRREEKGGGRRREEEGGGGSRRDSPKNKNPTQRCGEKHQYQEAACKYMAFKKHMSLDPELYIRTLITSETVTIHETPGS